MGITLVRIVEKPSLSHLIQIFLRYTYITHLASIQVFVHGNQNLSKLEIQKRGITLVRIVKKLSLSNLTQIFIRDAYIQHLTSIQLIILRLSGNQFGTAAWTEDTHYQSPLRRSFGGQNTIFKMYVHSCFISNILLFFIAVMKLLVCLQLSYQKPCRLFYNIYSSHVNNLKVKVIFIVLQY